MTADEAVVENEIVEGQPLTLEGGQPDSSPDTEEKQENKADGIQKRINALTAKRYEEQRRADAAEAKLRELESAKPVEAPQVVDVPSLPEDPYDSEAMAKYHRDMAANQVKVAQDAAKKAFQDSQKVGQEERQKAAQQQVIATYASNAVNDDVDIDKLRAAEAVLGQEGISPMLGQHIMMDKHGGKIAEYLYDNPIVRHELLALDPVSAGIKIANEIKPQALSSTPKVSNAPDPLTDVHGGGVDTKDEFERKYPDTVFI